MGVEEERYPSGRLSLSRIGQMLLDAIRSLPSYCLFSGYWRNIRVEVRPHSVVGLRMPTEVRLRQRYTLLPRSFRWILRVDSCDVLLVSFSQIAPIPRPLSVHASNLGISIWPLLTCTRTGRYHSPTARAPVHCHRLPGSRPCVQWPSQ